MSGILAIPHTGFLPIEMVQSLMNLKGTEVDIKFLRASLLYLAREEIIETCIADNYEYVLFVDSDMTFPDNLLMKLLSHNLPVVSAMCFKRTEPYSPCFFKTCDISNSILQAEVYSFDEIPTKLFEVEAVGMAATLIHREVLEKVKKPCFHPYEYCGEDVSFCDRVRKAGFKIYIDPSIIMGHIGNNTSTLFSYLEYKEKQNLLTAGAV
jgi:GT2 family glycosyltransferase